MGATERPGCASRWAAGAAALTAAIAAGVALAPPAEAVSRAAAERAAVRALNVRPSDDVVVFGLRQPLRARQSVSLAGPRNLGNGPPTALQRRALRPLGRRAWLFWADWVPGTAFSHPSTMVLIDDRAGRVLRREGMGFYPLIDGRRPPFLRSTSAYIGTRHRVLDQPGTTLVPNSSPEPTPPPAARAGLVSARAHADAGTFAADCVLMIGDHHSPEFSRDFDAMQQFFAKELRSRTGSAVKTFYATSGSVPDDGEPGEGSSYAGKTRSLANQVGFLATARGCKDVMFFIAGHGSRGSSAQEQRDFRRWWASARPNRLTLDAALRGMKPTAEPTVALGNGGELTASTLRRVMEEFGGTTTGKPKVTFKLKIASCFSGRFKKPLGSTGNVLMVETSSEAWEMSFFGSRWAGRRRPPGAVPNPKFLSEATNANLTRLRRYASAPRDFNADLDAMNSQSRLVALFQRAQEQGARADDASVLDRLSNPTFAARATAGAPLTPQFPADLNIEVRPTVVAGRGFRNLDVDIAGLPPGVAVKVTISRTDPTTGIAVPLRVSTVRVGLRGTTQLSVRWGPTAGGSVQIELPGGRKHSVGFFL